MHMLLQTLKGKENNALGIVMEMFCRNLLQKEDWSQVLNPLSLQEAIF